MTNSMPFESDWVSPPGETIEDALEELGMTQAEFAQRSGFSRKHVNGLIKGKVAMTAETALKLEAVLGAPSSFWLRREMEYREDLARRKALDDAAQLKDWLKELPLRELINLGWFNEYSHKGQQVLEALRFFGVASVDAWRVQVETRAPAFRASPKFAKQRGAVAAWLRKAELEAHQRRLAPFDRESLIGAIPQLRSLTNEANPKIFIHALQKTCGDCGVAVVFVPAPKGCPVSGATWWSAADRAVLALSLRHKTNDHLWFSFFHELGHLLKHGKKLRFVEGMGLDGLDTEKEHEANVFAGKTLIPQSFPLQRFSTGRISAEAVKSFARECNVAPGIVVGRLQHEGLLPRSHLNGLKARYSWQQG